MTTESENNKQLSPLARRAIHSIYPKEFTAEVNTHLDPTEAGFVSGKAVSLAKPDYPALARAGKLSRFIVVGILINEEGKVINAAPLCVDNDDVLALAARNAAKKARFSPTSVNGKPVKTVGQIVYNFVAR